MNFTLKDFSYDHPEELIAVDPYMKRDEARLLCLDRKSGAVRHRRFSNVIDELLPNDVLVLNNSKVFPCRLTTTRQSGGRQEVFLVRELSLERKGDDVHARWQVLINANKKVQAGSLFEFENLSVTIEGEAGGDRTAVLKYRGNLFSHLNNLATIPLPPYIKRETNSEDREFYQTVYAKEMGSVAAPTAGLHFTPELLEQIRKRGIQIAEVTLHVGPGTFLPVRTENILMHKMHEEFFSIDQKSCDVINAARQSGGRVIAVGTTTTRVLESVGKRNQNLAPVSSSTRIFIHPPYEFQIIDGLITNFHQPESTLLMLVCAFGGYQPVMQAYRDAIQNQYRLFSYGDAMVIM